MVQVQRATRLVTAGLRLRSKVVSQWLAALTGTVVRQAAQTSLTSYENPTPVLPQAIDAYSLLQTVRSLAGRLLRSNRTHLSGAHIKYVRHRPDGSPG